MEEMPFGEHQDYSQINLEDSAPLEAIPYDDNRIPYPAEDILSVEFTIKKPDGTDETIPGEMNEDGAGYVLYNDTDQVGTYVVKAVFVLESGRRISYRLTFDVDDPFDTTPATGYDAIADAVWLKLEDCFDSDEGGPWLRDVTKRYFNARKMPEFVAEAVMEINLQPPTTEVTVDEFTTVITINGIDHEDPDQALLTQGTLLAVIRHLMRSYTEQPNPTGATVVYEDRRDYLQRWQSIYQIEQQTYMRWLALWKRRYLSLGHSKMLIHSKAGRLVQAPMRQWGIGRGYYAVTNAPLLLMGLVHFLN